MLIKHQIYHGHYVCSFGRVAMSGGDGMNFSTRVPVASDVSVPVVLSYRTRH
jgi:hypothetical protein